MAQCFCGCGQTVSFRLRSVNKRGKIINGDLANIRLLLSRGLQSPNAEVFVHDGDLFCAALAEGVHQGIDPGPELERTTRGFMKFSRQNFSAGVLGKTAKRSGMSVDEAVSAMVDGRWDPFSDVQIPQD